MKARLLVTLLAVMAGCQRCSRDEPSSAPASSSDAAPRAAAIPSAVTTIDAGDAGEDPRALLSHIGFGALPKRAASSAVQANDAAFAKHRAGDFDASADGFARALALDPDFVLARYNHACALARRGVLAGAREELERVLAEDLLEYRDRLETDPDLESLRASPEMSPLKRRALALGKAYALARAEGLGAVLYDGGYRREESGVDIPSTFQLRVGAYHASSRRFVPLMRSVPNALTGYADFEMGYGIVVATSLSGSCGVVCFPLQPPATVVVASLDPSSRVQPGRALYPVEPLRGIDWAVDAWATKDGGAFSGWETFDRKGTTVTKVVLGTSMERTGAVLHVMGYRVGGVSLPPAPGSTVEKNSLILPDGRHIALPKEHAGLSSTVRVSHDGKTAAVVSHVDRCECSPFVEEFRHVVSRVDLDAEKAELLVRAEGDANVTFGPDDALYVQSNETFERIARTGEREKIWKGVMLAPPLRRATCCSA